MMAIGVVVVGRGMEKKGKLVVVVVVLALVPSITSLLISASGAEVTEPFSSSIFLCL